MNGQQQERMKEEGNHNDKSTMNGSATQTTSNINNEPVSGLIDHATNNNDNINNSNDEDVSLYSCSFQTSAINGIVSISDTTENDNKDDDTEDVQFDNSTTNVPLSSSTTFNDTNTPIHEKSLFLTIDHKLALRRRNTGAIKSFEECDTPSPSIRNDPLAPMLTKQTTESSAIFNNDNNNNNNNNSSKAANHEQGLKNMNGVARNLTLNSSSIKDQLSLKANHNLNQNTSDMATIARKLLISTFMTIFIAVVQAYTWITLPIYYLWQKPWIKIAANNRSRIKIYNPPNKTVSSSPSMTPIYCRDDSGIYNHKLFEYSTLTEIYKNQRLWNGSSRDCFGYRRVLSEEVLLDDHGKARRIDGRPLKQYRLSDYIWLTYEQVENIVKSIAQGFMAKGITKKNKILIISETRIEWMLCFQAAVYTGSPLVTVFSNLGLDGVAHAMIETDVETVISSIECLPLLKCALDLKSNEHKVKRIIYMEGYKKPEVDFGSEIEFISLKEIEESGKQIIKTEQELPFPIPHVDDLLVIMYTSGTTGTPKAVPMTQSQFVSVCKALFCLVRDIMHTAHLNVYISYLPMAHVLELTLEVFFGIGGVRLGYSSPFTITDSAPGLCPGQTSDIKLLQPTVMTTVPLVLDRIIKEVNDKLRARTPVSQPVFEFLMSYKSYWTEQGYDCGIVRKLLCKKVRDQLGGNLKYMICGGAPLNANTQAVIKSAVDVFLLQGYGATETTGATIVMDFDDLNYGRVGAPLNEVLFRLRNWEEGGYYINDQPNPRGEVLIGGPLVTSGYFKRPELTAESFFTDENGIRWFCTGDIAEVHPNGTVKFIDRCKDLIKLQNGEYISLGKVEAALKGCQLVDNACVYGGTFSNDIVALICPNRKALKQLAKDLGKGDLTIEQQCSDHKIHQVFLTEIIKTCKQSRLGKKEIPQRIKIVEEEWSPDNGVLTAAMKLKRRVVEKMYKQELYDLYNAKKFNVITTNGMFDQNNNSTRSTSSTTTTTTPT